LLAVVGVLPVRQVVVVEVLVVIVLVLAFL
jgi:hypothetical protein